MARYSLKTTSDAVNPLNDQQRVLHDHLLRKRTITSLEARSLYRIESLSSRICELARRGYVFRKILKKDLTGKRYVTYVLQGFPQGYPARYGV